MYRDVTAEDIGEMCEFSESRSFGIVHRLRLIDVIRTEGHDRYVAKNDDGIRLYFWNCRTGDNWREDTIPPYDDGRLAVVILNPDAPHEHYGKPVIVSCWSSKLKTTVDAIRIDRGHVSKWRLWDGRYGH